MIVLPTWVSVYHVYAWCPSRSEEDMDQSLGTDITDGSDITDDIAVLGVEPGSKTSRCS